MPCKMYITASVLLSSPPGRGEGPGGAELHNRDAAFRKTRSWKLSTEKVHIAARKKSPNKCRNAKKLERRQRTAFTRFT